MSISLEDLLTYFGYGVTEVTVTAEIAHYIGTVSNGWIRPTFLKNVSNVLYIRLLKLKIIQYSRWSSKINQF